MTSLPLAGLRVLDLTRVFAGPVAGRVLTDLGADVVKVEPPEGDISREWGRRIAGLSSYFTQQNCGKRDVCIDLGRPEGPGLVASLAAAADVVLENFRPGVLARFGLDWAALSARNPRLVMVSISGFGQDGPEAGRAAYASVLHAETGVMVGSEGEEPRDLGVSAADVISGLHGVIALLAALRVRDATGLGQHIDIAMIDAMAFSNDFIIDSLDGRYNDRRNGQIWPTAAGPVSLAGGLRWVWKQMSATYGLVDPTPADATIEEKAASRRRIVGEYLVALPDRTAVIETLERAGLAWGEIRELGRVLEQPTLQHRGSVSRIDDRAGGTRPVMRAPYRMSLSGRAEPGIAPHRGEHNAEVLGEWLGASESEIQRWAAAGVLARDEHAAR
jgi:crotonobetainyl-CoA:carnitine CoA-transferase CaiB-like acyl-CoA transferase